jgi:hypothetical protein
MSETNSALDAKAVEFIRRQHVFFVATAPLAADCRVNLSPKGLDTFAVIDERTVAYLDLHGSGIETFAHLRENGRIVLLWCAFDGPPQILRVHGRGEAFAPSDPKFAPLLAKFPATDGARSIVRVAVTRVATSCGWAVPLMKFEGDRPLLPEWSAKKGPAGLLDHQRRKNRTSIDGLPGIGG